MRGRANKSVAFGAKLSVSLTAAGIASVDHINWDAFHEDGDLPVQVEVYKQRYGHYSQSVLSDTIYGTRENRQCNPIDGKFGQGKWLQPKHYPRKNSAD